MNGTITMEQFLDQMVAFREFMLIVATVVGIVYFIDAIRIMWLEYRLDKKYKEIKMKYEMESERGVNHE